MLGTVPGSRDRQTRYLHLWSFHSSEARQKRNTLKKAAVSRAMRKQDRAMW